jgi:hypothetical protein
MKKIRILMIVAVFIALLIPVAVSAAGVFYCSASISSGGDGSYAYPWACSTDAQVNSIINDVICRQYNGGHLYRIFANSYVYYRITPVAATVPQCTVTQTEYPGYPPNTGPDLPLPLILGTAAVIGVVLVGAGLTLRRRATI